jgi:succinyl-CoA synthetase alpha subunit
MSTFFKVVSGTYRDSVALMQLAQTLKRRPGIDEASAVMATPANLALLGEIGLLEGAPRARPMDILLAVRAQDAELARGALSAAEAGLNPPAPPRGRDLAPAAPRSIAGALAGAREANLALISVPGAYAAAEARKALSLGLSVMLFSDNVTLADEVALKQLAAARGLIVMGPDCGTAMLGGVPLGFCNQLRRGPLGCIGASGTGIQQVTSLADRLGVGTSHAIGTGGRDLSEAVGGISTLHALRALAADQATRVIVLVGKSPAPAVAQRVLAEAARCGKPVVACFLGAAPSGKEVHGVATLEHAALLAVALAQGGPAPPDPESIAAPSGKARAQGWIRGLYSGGTFSAEAVLILESKLGRVWSNTPLREANRLRDPWKSREHSVLDLGDDVFTRGRAHPMIDPGLRNERIVREAQDPAVAAILIDVVLGHGSHADPAGEAVSAITLAREKRQKPPHFVAFVCGTDADPQGRAAQESALAGVGVIVAQSNAEAVRTAAALVRS